MRVTSLMLLAIVAVGAFYVFYLRPKWVVDVQNKVTGYGPAESPTDAVDKFLKCVKNRDLKTAAEFCTGDYAELLKRGATATKEMGPVIDGIAEYMKNKGLATDKAITYLHFLDPFPTNIKTRGMPKEKGEIAIAFCEMENIWPGQQPVDLASLAGNVDPKMFNRVFMSLNLLNPNGFEVVKEGGSWKLKLPVTGNQQFVDHYLNNYKGYHTGLTVFRRDVTNDRFPSKQDFEAELVKVLEKAKG
jgi:hypothetical protein